jgi:hypothetical protein
MIVELFSRTCVVRAFMETQRGFERWLKAVVSQAETLGQLRYRRALIQDELKNLATRTAREWAWLKAKGAPAEALAVSRETILVLAHQQCLAEQDSDQLGRLIIAVQEDMTESINDLAKTVKLEPLEIALKV